ncbi:MAG: hypothetical protein FJ218_08290, partial [Ignavibacteria bacterium]|nr:hypothetical protein [Ignavibacteria bacterium]
MRTKLRKYFFTSSLRGVKRRSKFQKIASLSLAITVLFTANLFSQTDSSQTRFTFLPEKHQFRQLIANPYEARIGLWKFFTAEQMKVEIGAEQDLFSFQTENSSLNIGINFFGFANVTGANGLHLQIDALDGFFGGNISLINPSLHYRLRILHHSAHLVDGNWWAHTYPRDWTKPGGPIPFTQDFGELLLAKLFSLSNVESRLYGGVSYSTFSRPGFVKRISFLEGIEIHSNAFTGKLFKRETNLFFAFHNSLVGIPKYAGSNQTKFGIKFGDWERSGINVYIALNFGKSFFGE